MAAKRRWILCLSLMLVWSLAGCNRGHGVEAADENRTETLLQSEQDFMTKAWQANTAELDMARIAHEKSGNTDVRDFANMIETDHKSALEDLTDLMKDNDLPEPKTIVAATQQDINRMERLTGPEFDREFVNMMVTEHQNTVEMFRDQQSTAQNGDLRNYVDSVLPVLEMHLDKARQLQSKLFSR